MAKTLGNLGSERAWVVHGSDGLDELTTTGPSFVADLREDGTVSCYEVSPKDAGLPEARPDDLKGGSPDVNAQAIRDMLDGKPGPYRDVVLLNAAAGLLVAGKAADLKDGVAQAGAAIESGKARATLDRLVRITTAESLDEITGEVGG